MWFEGLGAVQSLGTAVVISERRVVQRGHHSLGSVASDHNVDGVGGETAVAPDQAAGGAVTEDAEAVAQLGIRRSCHLCELLRCQEVPAEERAEKCREVL